jgi:uncharacterized membrane-anchored protein YhcB (DUF1043 family)
MTEQAAPSMTKVLENVEADLTTDPTINRFAPPRLRQQALNNGELESIQHDLRKNFAEAAELHKRLQAYCDSLKTAIEALTRSAN